MGSVKLCTVFQVEDGQPSSATEISLVGDDHEFGLSPDGRLLHVEGRITQVRPSKSAPPSFTCPRCGMTSYNENDIREGYCGNCHDWTGQSR